MADPSECPQAVVSTRSLHGDGWKKRASLGRAVVAMMAFTVRAVQ